MKGVVDLLHKYKQQDGSSRVLLLFLLLGKNDISKIDHYEEEVEERLFGLKIRKIYGVTSEYVDTAAMERGIEDVQCPVICSEQLFESYAQSDVLYKYEAKIPDRPLYINDMGVLSKAMMITKDCVVSSNRALPELEADTDNLGFMFFVDYVVRNRTSIGKWKLEYDSDIDGGTFDIYYISADDDEQERKELIYSISSVDKPSTYKIVIYIIKKVASQLEDIAADNFKETVYTLIK